MLIPSVIVGGSRGVCLRPRREVAQEKGCREAKGESFGGATFVDKKKEGTMKG